jgi:hypothetical protein
MPLVVNALVADVARRAPSASSATRTEVPPGQALYGLRVTRSALRRVRRRQMYGTATSRPVAVGGVSWQEIRYLAPHRRHRYPIRIGRAERLR